MTQTKQNENKKKNEKKKWKKIRVNKLKLFRDVYNDYVIFK